MHAMATEILLPKIGFSMNEGQIAEWMFGDGEEVAEGDVLYLLEADKSANEVEAPASGILRILGVEGETYEVGTVIGYIE
ncbi:biotin-requiring enzyme family protein [Blastomonas sp. RAC04]|nr:biotin-requiring enzyme family protein [Blastomonas sp. RAC04]